MARKAYWIQHSHLFGGDDFECSACGYETDRPYKYCPNCDRPMGRPKYDAAAAKVSVSVMYPLRVVLTHPDSLSVFTCQR